MADRVVALCCVVIVSAGAAGGGAPPTPHGTTLLEVRIVYGGTEPGLAGVALWGGGRGFPEDIAHAVLTTYVPITDGEAHASFAGLDPGRYAVTVYHDENANRRFDKNWLGIPREAWGVSNNVRPRLRAPRFDEAGLDLGPGETAIEIRLEGG